MNTLSVFFTDVCSDRLWLISAGLLLFDCLLVSDCMAVVCQIDHIKAALCLIVNVRK